MKSNGIIELIIFARPLFLITNTRGLELETAISRHIVNDAYPYRNLLFDYSKGLEIIIPLYGAGVEDPGSCRGSSFLVEL